MPPHGPYSNTLQGRAAAWVAVAVLMFGNGAWAQAAAAAGMSTAECMACHGKLGQGRVTVDKTKLEGSSHGTLECNACHKDVQTYPHDPKPKTVDCSGCHAAQVDDFKKSVHASVKDAAKAPSCTSCHGTHDILPSKNPASLSARANIPQTCGKCHGVGFTVDSPRSEHQPYIAYEESVHGRSVTQDPNSKAAVCTDCHYAHDILLPNNPDSPIARMNIPDTCGECHEEVAEVFKSSIHGVKLARGALGAPSCADCHGIHTIRATVDPRSPVSKQNVARMTCARCHEAVRLTSNSGAQVGRGSSYFASYHGLATQLGARNVANCASCHGVHNIFTSEDPRSTIHPDNLQNTCGQCHPGATQNFVTAKVHVDPPDFTPGGNTDFSNKVTGYVRWIYLTIIWTTVVGMVLHNGILWYRKSRAHRQNRGATVVRMNGIQRFQHFVLLLSFIILVLSGFALAYPGSVLGWMFASEDVRRTTHRAAAVAMTVISAFHLGYLIFTREGRKLFRDFVPKLKDAVDVKDVFVYYLRGQGAKPRFTRFNYAEKFEYWALIWGTLVMVVTGFALWFNLSTAQLVPGWVLDVATAIHFYEAVLATVAILIWHFYQVIFDPDVYPMNWAWLDGKMSVHHYKEEHGLDTETLQGAPESPDTKHKPSE